MLYIEWETESPDPHHVRKNPIKLSSDQVGTFHEDQSTDENLRSGPRGAVDRGANWSRGGPGFDSRMLQASTQIQKERKTGRQGAPEKG